MERRRFKRIVVMLEAKIISCAKSYPGFLENNTADRDLIVYTYAGIIENISENGMLICFSEITKLNVDLGERLEVAFQLPSGERLNLNCMVTRYQDAIDPQDPEQRIGVEIVDPPTVFREYLQSMLDRNE